MQQNTYLHNQDLFRDSTHHKDITHIYKNLIQNNQKKIDKHIKWKLVKDTSVDKIAIIVLTIKISLIKFNLMRL